jgi:hypothetical protein
VQAELSSLANLTAQGASVTKQPPIASLKGGSMPRSPLVSIGNH